MVYIPNTYINKAITCAKLLNYTNIGDSRHGVYKFLCCLIFLIKNGYFFVTHLLKYKRWAFLVFNILHWYIHYGFSYLTFKKVLISLYLWPPQRSTPISYKKSKLFFLIIDFWSFWNISWSCKPHQGLQPHLRDYHRIEHKHKIPTYPPKGDQVREHLAYSSIP